MYFKSIRLVVYFIWIRIRFTTRAAKERERKNSEAETKCLAQQFERLARVSSGAAKKPMKRYSKSVWCIEKRNVGIFVERAMQYRQKIDSVKWK